MGSPQLTRFQNDFRDLQRLAGESSIFRFTPHGTPASVFDCVFEGRGLHVPREGAAPEPLSRHQFRIELTSEYPRRPPIVFWQTPIYHPNFAANKVCTGNLNKFWVPGFKLVTIVEMLWDMVRYKNVEPGDPFNRDAAHWFQHQTVYRWPLDERPIRDGMHDIEIVAPGNASDDGIMIL